MLFEAIVTARDLGRLQEIVRVFVAHGMADLVQRLGVVRGLRRAGHLLRIPRAETLHDRPAPERMRLAFEQLGPTFVKLGQLLAGRTDLLPAEWTSEFRKLREHAAPVAWEELRAQIAEDLHADPDSVFAHLDPAPLASASIAQVHRARLSDGTEVVLKVRRPGIVATVSADLRLLARLAELAESELPELRRWKARAIVRQFASSIRRELDFSLEAHVAARIARQIASHAEIAIPAVHSRFTTQRLLVLDFLSGPSIDTWIASGCPGGIDPRALAEAGTDVVLEMVFVHGLYHADPHGGNVLVLPDGRLGLLDFGMVGRLSQSRRREFLQLLASVVERREHEAVQILLEWSGDSDVDESLLALDVAAFLDRYHGASLQEIDVTALLGDIAALVRDNGIVLPVDVAMLLKVFVTLDGLGLALDPSFRMSARVEPFVEREMRDATALLPVLRRGVGEFRRAIRDLPQLLRPLLSRLRRGRLKIDIEVGHLEQFGRDLQKSANRITIGLVTSALIVGTSIALTVSGGSTLLGFPAFALMGFVSSLVLAIVLLVSIARSSHG